MRVPVVLAVRVLLSACGSGSPTAPEPAFRVIGHGGLPLAPELRRAEPFVVVVRDSGEWADFIARSELRAPSFNPEDPIPSIDFSTEMAIALLLGQRPTSGYQIRVDRMTLRGAMVVVSATEVVPCGGATVITYPLTAIAAPRSNRIVTVEWSREEPHC